MAFWGLDVALGVRVNQYKSVCVILSFPDLTYVYFKLFLLTADRNNRLNHKNNRLIFWKSTKIALCIVFHSFLICDSSLAFIIPSKFAKIFHKQFTPLLFKVIYSNRFDTLVIKFGIEFATSRPHHITPIALYKTREYEVIASVHGMVMKSRP